MTNALPENCDGFNVTHFCSRHSRECVAGCCWHMDRVRMMVRRWFSLVGPPVRLGASLGAIDKPMVLKQERKPTKEETEEANQIDEIAGLVTRRRADAWHAEFERRWRGVPDRLWRYHDTGGGMSVWPDEDGVGSWGRVVRLIEDAR